MRAPVSMSMKNVSYFCVPWFLLTWGAGCADTETQVGALLASPSGLAVAGTETRRLFIANSGDDTVQVANLGQSLDQLDFVASVAQYFPLRVQVGPNPEDLAATPDGRYVVVMSSVNDVLRVLDADTLSQVADDDDEPLQLVVGPAGAGLSALVASPTGCDSPCVGRFFVVMSGVGAVQEVLLLETQEETQPGAPRFELGDLFSVGGRPREAAISQDGQTLYVTDAGVPELIRLDLNVGVVDRLDIGEVGGPVAVSTDDSLVLVGRLRTRDVVVVEVPSTSTWATLDADPRFAPPMVCLDDCGAVGCPAATHPADLAVCATGAGLESTANIYEGLYLRRVPAQILTLGTGGAWPELEGPVCSTTPGATQQQVFSEYALVTTLDGEVHFVSLRDAEGGLDVGLVDELWCMDPSVQAAEGTDLEPEDLLAEDCPDSPDRERFACEDGVVMLPGVTGFASIALEWEGPVLERQNGGGQIVEGRLIDLGVDLQELEIRPGDVVEIISQPLNTPECPLSPTVDPCELERRVVSLADVELQGRTFVGLQLDGVPLPDDCFREGGAVSYRIRAGDAFLVSAYGQTVRVVPGEALGPGTGVAEEVPALLRIRDLDPRSDLGACERYGETGLQPPLSRDEAWVFELRDAFAPLRTGFLLDGGAPDPTTPAGRLPTGIVASQSGASGPVVFVGYGGSDRVLAVVPFDASTLYDETRYRIFQ